jgi:hypothetical protein
LQINEKLKSILGGISVAVAHHEAYRHCFQLFITVRSMEFTTHLFAIMQILIENH